MRIDAQFHIWPNFTPLAAEVDSPK